MQSVNETATENRQPWIYSAAPDSIFILAPPFLITLIIFLFPGMFHDGAEVSPVFWIILVLCVDVAHVYSTLYRTYFDPETFGTRKNLFLLVPLLVFIFGVLVYSMNGLIFWRIAAYLAVFHFIRQQYGFLRIYSRREKQPKWSYTLDTITIYLLTVYPILWWHLSGPRNFSWFVDGDFYFVHMPWLLLPLQICYWSIASAWVMKEIYFSVKNRFVNVPKFLLMAGTGLSWYLGIITFNGDLVFTALNVISHGIPYMALIWMHGNKKHVASIPEKKKRTFISAIFRPRYLFLFVGILILIAYLEEGLWDRWVWNDHPQYFTLFHFLPKISDSYLAFIVPLLAVPQLTHYVLDGFIWRIQKDKFNWKNVTLDNHDQKK